MNEDAGNAEVQVALTPWATIKWYRAALQVTGNINTTVTRSGTATAGDDYSAIPSQVLTFAGNLINEIQTFTVPIIDDSTYLSPP